MLDIGFSELLLIAVAAIVVVGPKDLPVVVKHVARFMRELRGLYAGLRKQVDGLIAEAGIDDLKHEMTTIIDLDGKPQQAYDVRELEGLKFSTSGAAGETLSPCGRGSSEARGEGAMRVSAQLDAPPSQPSPARGEGAPAAPLADKTTGSARGGDA